MDGPNHQFPIKDEIGGQGFVCGSKERKLASKHISWKAPSTFFLEV